MPEYDPLLTMSALNMAIVSLHRITSTRDRLILDREYKNIINNIRMGEINADPELTSLYQDIVRVIYRGRLRSEVLESIESSYTEQKQNSISEIVTENILPSFSLNPLKWLGKLAASSASEYFSLKEESKQTSQNQQEQRKLKTEELNEYDELQRKLLESSWKLLRQYKLPDSYMLTQNALDDFYRAVQESDPSKRLRMLRSVESDFVMYSPYWFCRAKAAHDSDNHEEEVFSFRKFNEVWRPVLRKDPYKLEALKFRINELVNSGVKDDDDGEIFVCLSEFEQHTQRNDWANHIYASMLYFTLGHKEKALNCVMCNIDFGYETEASQAVLSRFENELPYLKFSYFIYNAEKGNAIAQCFLGYTYEKGVEVKQNLSEAVNWYLKSAEQGYASAQYFLGLIYEREQNYSEAMKWYRKAAEQKYIYAPAKFYLDIARMYYFDEGVEKDFYEAFKYSYNAAELGDANAQFVLGFMYSNAEGTAQDYEEAVKCYLKAAEQGHAKAQYNLGFMYENGYGVPQDKTEAEKWYRKAAENGFTDTQKKTERLNLAAMAGGLDTK